jgi:thiaminase/transcriptional activator TenA
MLAYTRYVLDAGMRGDLLALKVALAPCRAIRCADRNELLSRLDRRVCRYAIPRVAAKARAHLDLLADLYATPAREGELIAIFKEATRLEADFWEMGWRPGQRVE